LLRTAVNSKTMQTIAWIAFVAVLLFSVPIPLSFKIIQKDSTTPYPCQNSPCGCNSAEQCWTTCRCFSIPEKLAWAQKNGVEPPTYANLDEIASPAASNNVTQTSATNTEASTCQCGCSATPKASTPPKPICSCGCSSHDECASECEVVTHPKVDKSTSVETSCCCSNTPGPEPDNANCTEPELAADFVWVLSIAAQKCCGVDLDYVFAVVPDATPVCGLIVHMPATGSVAVENEFITIFLRQPPSPPPPELAVS
jgi:hypothetical protein